MLYRLTPCLLQEPTCSDPNPDLNELCDLEKKEGMGIQCLPSMHEAWV